MTDELWYHALVFLDKYRQELPEKDEFYNCNDVSGNAKKLIISGEKQNWQLCKASLASMNNMPEYKAWTISIQII